MTPVSDPLSPCLFFTLCCHWLPAGPALDVSPMLHFSYPLLAGQIYNVPMPKAEEGMLVGTAHLSSPGHWSLWPAYGMS